MAAADKKPAAEIKVLVADSDEPGRRMIAGMLEAQGYKVYQAVDGGSAIRAAGEHNVEVAVIGHQMSPRTGFDFARHVMLHDMNIGMIMVTTDDSTDILIEAGKHGIKQIMKKPVDPGRLSETIRRVLRAQGRGLVASGLGAEPAYSREELMRRALALAQQNARSLMGGPFGAIVADEEGHILGEGVNAVTVRCDPTAHAEVMAIRRATERRGSTRLDSCIVYCSSEPTMLGQALIISTGIQKVYYGLSHTEVGATRTNEEGIIGEIARPLSQRTVPYEQMHHDEAAALFRTWQKQDRRVAD